MIRNCWLGVLLTVWLALAGAISAQEGGTPDRLFEIDDFSGLNLYQEKTRLEIGQALLGENIQFRKPGTISVLDRLTKLSDVMPDNKPLRGLGSIKDFINDSDRIVTACSTFFFNTYGNSLSNWVRSSAEVDTAARWWTTAASKVWQDSTGHGRAAELWRAGWKVSANLAPAPGFEQLTIDYVSDNNTFYTTAVPDSIGNHLSLSNQVWPVTFSESLPVRYVNVDVSGTPMVVVLQAGMEPMLYDGRSLSSMRFFGVADSGTVQRVDTCAGTGGEMYVVDNSKINIYGQNEVSVFGTGYWLHLPYNYGDGDSSHWGRTWEIDSTTINDTDATGNVEYRIFFTVGQTGGYMPSGWGSGLKDSLHGSPYQFLSAPFLRDELTADQSPNATIADMGVYVKFPTGLLAAHAYDHVPHVLTFERKTDTVVVDYVRDSIWYCDRAGCRWLYSGGIINTPARAGKFSLPIRTVFTDTVGTDATVIWTSGANASYGTTDFTSSEWTIYRASIPFASDGAVYEGRLFLGGDPQEPNFISYSEPDDIGAFPVTNAFILGSNGDRFTRFAKIYNWLVIFQKEHTWILKGDPDDAVFELALPDEGCIAAGSIVELENRVIYLSEKGWRVFDGNTAQDFAMAIKPAVQAQPRVEYSVNQSAKSKSVAAYDPTTGNIWMSMPFGTSANDNGSFLQNFVDRSFSYSNEVYGGCILSTTFRDTLRLFFTHPDSGQIFVYGYGDSLDVTGIDGNKMVAKWSSGWLDMGSKYKDKKISDGVLHVSLSSPNSAIDSTRRLYTRFYRDYDSLPFYADTLNVVGVVGGKHYEVETSVRLEPRADSATVEWLRVEIEGSGLNLMDVRALALRFNDGVDVFRDRTKAIRP